MTATNRHTEETSRPSPAEQIVVVEPIIIGRESVLPELPTTSRLLHQVFHGC
jgi:hypothetical protein